MGFPLEGEKILWVAIINSLASMIASTERVRGLPFDLHRNLRCKQYKPMDARESHFLR